MQTQCLAYWESCWGTKPWCPGGPACDSSSMKSLFPDPWHSKGHPSLGIRIPFSELTHNPTAASTSHRNWKWWFPLVPCNCHLFMFPIHLIPRKWRRDIPVIECGDRPPQRMDNLLFCPWIWSWLGTTGQLLLVVSCGCRQAGAGVILKDLFICLGWRDCNSWGMECLGTP